MVEDGETEDVENGFDAILTNVTATKNSFQYNVESQLANETRFCPVRPWPPLPNDTCCSKEI